VQFIHQRRTRKGIRACTPDPTHANDRSFNRFHQTSSLQFLEMLRPVGRAAAH